MASNMKNRVRKLLQILINNHSFLGKTVRTCIRIYDPLLISVILGERFVFQRLQQTGFLDNLESKRILEIGPKHGKDSLLLAGLGPRELVLLWPDFKMLTYGKYYQGI